MPFPPERTTRHAGRGHLKALDGIRGLAILMVLVHHAFRSNFAAGGRLGQIAGNFIFYGRFGVDLFFVLSGFLITGILLDTREDPHFFKKFYGRRALRIFPLYYGVLFLLFALTPLLHLQWQDMGWLLLTDLQNLRPYLASNLMLHDNLGLFHFWSLAVEEQFYLLWPAVVFLIRDRRILFRTTLALLAASIALRLAVLASGHGILAIHVTMATRADSLLLGGILAMLFRSESWPRVLRIAPAAFAISLAAILASIALLGPDEDLRRFVSPYAASFWISGVRYSALALCFGSLLVWSLRPQSRVQTIFQQPTLRFFGKYSYGIYVLHVPAITLLLYPLRGLFRDLTHSKGLAVAGSGIIALVLSVLAAVLSFHLFEKPFLRLKRFFDYEVTTRPIGDPVAGAILPAPSGRMAGVVKAIPQHSVSTR